VRLGAARRQFEAAVIGGGPAGCAAAITLARAGCPALLIDGEEGEAFKVGEGLPPAAKPLLRALGVFERFSREGHLPSYGNESAWGSDVPRCADFIRDPQGHGWHLDRRRFDAMLREGARDAGACVREATRVVDAIRTGRGSWRLTLAAKEGLLEAGARWLIDSTGRRSWLARREGVKRASRDRLLGFVALFRPPDTALTADRDSLTLVESMPEGWWYTALLPTRRRVVVYLTDAGAATSRLARTREGYLALLARTRHVRDRLAAHDYRMEGAPQVTAANSARLDRFVGERWIAVGDAATSFDPLSSQGILTALYSGLQAGQALLAHRSDRSDALERYNTRLGALYDLYLRHRATYYRLEQRWPTSPFWQARWMEQRPHRPGPGD
jgi:flavin-dependent dehydrogenase